MRTTFYLTIVLAALFISSSEARPLRKRTGTDEVSGFSGGAGGERLESLTGGTDGLFLAKRQGDRRVNVGTDGSIQKNRNRIVELLAAGVVAKLLSEQQDATPP